MTTPPKLYHDYPIEVSTRYAQDQALRAQMPTPQETTISKSAEVDVHIPMPQNIDLLFGEVSKATPFATIDAPEGYNTKNLFLHSLVSWLDTDEKVDLLMTRINEQKIEVEEGVPSWEQSTIEEKHQKDLKNIRDVLNTIKNKNRVIIDINSRKTQYLKG